jgi:polyphosphate kinase
MIEKTVRLLMQEFCKRRFLRIPRDIFWNNLDEFFRVRFAAINDHLNWNYWWKYPMESQQQLVKDTEIVIEQQSESLRILNIIESEC